MLSFVFQLSKAKQKEIWQGQDFLLYCMLKLFTQTMKYTFLNYHIDKLLTTVISHSILWPSNYKLKH